MTHREFVAEADTLPEPGQVACAVFWGCHGCELVAGHAGEHVCAHKWDAEGVPLLHDGEVRVPLDHPDLFTMDESPKWGGRAVAVADDGSVTGYLACGRKNKRARRERGRGDSR